MVQYNITLCNSLQSQMQETGHFFIPPEHPISCIHVWHMGLSFLSIFGNECINETVIRASIH